MCKRKFGERKHQGGMFRLFPDIDFLIDRSRKRPMILSDKNKEINSLKVTLNKVEQTARQN